MISACFDWDWHAAESNFKRAFDLNPSYATAHHWYALYLSIKKHYDEAITETKKALELDPLSLVINNMTAYYLYFLRRYDEALQSNLRTLEMYSNSGLPYLSIGYIYLAKGKYKEAVSSFQKSIDVSGRFSWAEGSLGYTYGIIGEKKKAEKILLEMIEKRKENYISSYYIAEIYTGLGEYDTAFEWLENSYKERDSQLILIHNFHQWNPIRSDPRFKALLKKMGLPED